MKIAVPYDNGNIYDHYGNTECFKMYDIEDQKIVAVSEEKTGGRGHFYMVQFLVNHHVDLVLCKSMGSPAKSALEIAGISYQLGMEGNADEAVKLYISGGMTEE